MSVASASGRPGLLFGIATAVPERVRTAATLIRKLVAEQVLS